MKRTYPYLVFVLTFVLAVACSGKKETTEAAVASDTWPAMDEFHMIMAESFHPYKDSANLAPAIANAVEMSAMAEKWASQPLPEKVNNEETKATLARLKSDAGAFAFKIQSGDTTQIAESLTGLHDLFHKLQESWYADGGEGHDHEHEHEH